MLDQLIQDHVSGKVTRADLLGKHGVPKRQLDRSIYGSGISSKTHVWLQGKGYISKSDSLGWQALHSEYELGLSLRELGVKYGVSADTLCQRFKAFSFPLLTSHASMLRTIQSKCGVSHPIKMLGVKKKIEETCLVRWGCKHPMSNKLVHQRALDKAAQSSGRSFFERMQGGLRKAHGVDFPLQVPGAMDQVLEKKRLVSERRVVAMLRAGGYDLVGGFVGLHSAPGAEKSWLKYQVRHVSCGDVFEACLAKVPICPVCFPRGDYRSQLELSYESYIQSLGFSPIHGKKVIQMPSGGWGDIDIYLPEQRLGFEVNGLYYHSSGDCTWSVDPEYHRSKSEAALKAGIRLYHIWSHSPDSVVRSGICSALGKVGNRVGARDCSVCEVESGEVSEFYASNHVHGSVQATVSVGLRVSSGDLVASLSLRPLFKHPGWWEIARFAVSRNMSVAGGFSRLLKAALVILKGRKEVVGVFTYADRDFSPVWQGTVYAKCGFQFLGDTGPSLFYTDFRSVWPRQHFQKHKLPFLFPDTFDPSLSGQDNLALQGIFPLYTSGNWKFSLAV